MPMTSDAARGERAIDAMRLTDAEIRDLHRGLDQYQSDQFHREMRVQGRFAYRCGRRVEVEVVHPGGSVSAYLVEPRDISSGGFGFLHGGFLHPGSICRVMLIDATGVRMAVTGRVVRCSLVGGRTHVVGVALDEKLDLARFATEAGSGASGGASGGRGAGQGEARLVSQLQDSDPTGRMLAEAVEQMNAASRDVVQALGNHRLDLAVRQGRLLGLRAQRSGYPTIAARAAALCDRLAGDRLDPLWKQDLAELGKLLVAARRGLEAA